MRRILPFTLITLMLTTSVALAERGSRGRDRDDRRARPAARYDAPPARRDVRPRARVEVRDHRSARRPARSVERSRTRTVVRSERRVRVERRPVYVDRGRYVFHGGVVHTYRAPKITTRYVDVRVRPRVLVETYDPMPGYVWVAGHWRWDGYEWLWTPGHYAPDPAYVDPYDAYDGYYDDGSYDGGYRY